MDRLDRLIHNRSQIRSILAAAIILIVSAAASWFISAKFADIIISRQLNSLLDLTNSESTMQKYGITYEIDPRFMENWDDTRLVIFWLCFGFACISVIVLLVIALRESDKAISELDKIYVECRNIADGKISSVELQSKDFGSVSRITEGIELITDRMSNLTSSLSSEKNFLREFLTDLSHQLKTSLAVIRLNSDIISEIGSLSEEKKAQLTEEISFSLDSMEQLVVSALKLAKLNADAVEYNMNPADLSLVCSEAIKRLAPLLRDHDISVKFAPDRPVIMNYDHIWLCEAIENVVKNCIDHSGCSAITVTLAQNPIITNITITDNGNGIPQQDIPDIFRRFGRRSTGNSMSSVGIGMSIAQKIIQAHNGNIFVYSKLGEGSTFDLSFVTAASH